MSYKEEARSDITDISTGSFAGVMNTNVIVGEALVDRKIFSHQNSRILNPVLSPESGMLDPVMFMVKKKIKQANQVFKDASFDSDELPDRANSRSVKVERLDFMLKEADNECNDDECFKMIEPLLKDESIPGLEHCIETLNTKALSANELDRLVLKAKVSTVAYLSQFLTTFRSKVIKGNYFQKPDEDCCSERMLDDIFVKNGEKLQVDLEYDHLNVTTKDKKLEMEFQNDRIEVSRDEKTRTNKNDSFDITKPDINDNIAKKFDALSVFRFLQPLKNHQPTEINSDVLNEQKLELKNLNLQTFNYFIRRPAQEPFKPSPLSIIDKETPYRVEAGNTPIPGNFVYITPRCSIIENKEPPPIKRPRLEDDSFEVKQRLDPLTKLRDHIFTLELASFATNSERSIDNSSADILTHLSANTEDVKEGFNMLNDIANIEYEEEPIFHPVIPKHLLENIPKKDRLAIKRYSLVDVHQIRGMQLQGRFDIKNLNFVKRCSKPENQLEYIEEIKQEAPKRHISELTYRYEDNTEDLNELTRVFNHNNKKVIIKDTNEEININFNEDKIMEDKEHTIDVNIISRTNLKEIHARDELASRLVGTLLTEAYLDQKTEDKQFYSFSKYEGHKKDNPTHIEHQGKAASLVNHIVDENQTMSIVEEKITKKIVVNKIEDNNGDTNAQSLHDLRLDTTIITSTAQQLDDFSDKTNSISLKKASVQHQEMTGHNNLVLGEKEEQNRSHSSHTNRQNQLENHSFSIKSTSCQRSDMGVRETRRKTIIESIKADFKRNHSSVHECSVNGDKEHVRKNNTVGFDHVSKITPFHNGEYNRNIEKNEQIGDNCMGKLIGKKPVKSEAFDDVSNQGDTKIGCDFLFKPKVLGSSELALDNEVFSLNNSDMFKVKELGSNDDIFSPNPLRGSNNKIKLVFDDLDAKDSKIMCVKQLSIEIKRINKSRKRRESGEAPSRESEQLMPESKRQASKRFSLTEKYNSNNEIPSAGLKDDHDHILYMDHKDTEEIRDALTPQKSVENNDYFGEHNFETKNRVNNSGTKDIMMDVFENDDDDDDDSTSDKNPWMEFKAQRELNIDWNDIGVIEMDKEIFNEKLNKSDPLSNDIFRVKTCDQSSDLSKPTWTNENNDLYADMKTKKSITDVNNSRRQLGFSASKEVHTDAIGSYKELSISSESQNSESHESYPSESDSLPKCLISQNCSNNVDGARADTNDDDEIALVSVIVDYKCKIVAKMNKILSTQAYGQRRNSYKLLEKEMSNMVSLMFLRFIKSISEPQIDKIVKIQRYWRKTINIQIIRKIVKATKFFESTCRSGKNRFKNLKATNNFKLTALDINETKNAEMFGRKLKIAYD